MGLNKPTKPKWADGAPQYAVEPGLAKKTVGWLPQEKPPFQWMNWLFLKIKQWIDWGEERTDFSESMLFYTTGGNVDWSGTQVTVPAGGMYLEWRERAAIKNNILPAGDYALSDGQYLVFIPHTTSGTLLSAANYNQLTPGKYAIVAGANLIDNTTYTEVIIFRRRNDILEAPLFKSAVQAGGSFAKSDLLVHHHSDADDGGQLDWDTCWADALHDHSDDANGGKLDWDTCWVDAVHSHQSDAEGGKLDHGAALEGLGDDDHPQYAHLNKAGQTFLEKISGQTPTAASNLATKNYVDNHTYVHTHDVTDSGITETSWAFEFSLTAPGGTEVEEFMWPCSRNCTADGKIYFYEEAYAQIAMGELFILFHNFSAGSELRLKDDDTGGNDYTIDSISSVGGGEYVIQINGSPDLSMYTTGQNARFHFVVGMFLKAKQNTSVGPETGQNNVNRFRVALCCDHSGWTTAITIKQNGNASDDITFASLAGIWQYNGTWSSDNAILVGPGSWDGTYWCFELYFRKGSGTGDVIMFDLNTVIIPRTTSS